MKFFYILSTMLLYLVAIENFSFIQASQFAGIFVFFSGFFMLVGVAVVVTTIYDWIDSYSKDSE